MVNHPIITCNTMVNHPIITCNTKEFMNQRSDFKDFKYLKTSHIFLFIFS